MTDQGSPSEGNSAVKTVDDRMAELVRNINLWREWEATEYWVKVSYLGGELNRFGDHELTFVDDKLWHLWHGEWREIKRGSDFWLLSVVGAFAWARDMITKVLPQRNEPSDVLRIVYDDEYGYVKLLQFEAAHRDASNFTFEVKRFELGPHEAYKR